MLMPLTVTGYHIADHHHSQRPHRLLGGPTTLPEAQTRTFRGLRHSFQRGALGTLQPSVPPGNQYCTGRLTQKVRSNFPVSPFHKVGRQDKQVKLHSPSFSSAAFQTVDTAPKEV